MEVNFGGIIKNQTISYKIGHSYNVGTCQCILSGTTRLQFSLVRRWGFNLTISTIQTTKQNVHEDGACTNLKNNRLEIICYGEHEEHHPCFPQAHVHYNNLGTRYLYLETYSNVQPWPSIRTQPTSRFCNKEDHHTTTNIHETIAHILQFLSQRMQSIMGNQ